MSFIFTIIIFLISIFITQYIGKKKIFYIRFFNFLVLNLFLFFLINYLFELEYLLINFLLCLSLIFSWAGFVIHISNSIFLSLLRLINENDISNYNDLFLIYKQEEKFSERINVLINGGYLINKDQNIRFNKNFKNNFLTRLIIFLKD